MQCWSIVNGQGVQTAYLSIGRCSAWWGMRLSGCRWPSPTYSMRSSEWHYNGEVSRAGFIGAAVVAIVVMTNLWVASTLSLLNLKTCQALEVVQVPTKSVTPSSSISAAGAAAQCLPIVSSPTPCPFRSLASCKTRTVGSGQVHGVGLGRGQREDPPPGELGHAVGHHKAQARTYRGVGW